MPINWVDVPDPRNPPAGAPAISAANLAKLAVTADIGTPGTPTGDALKAAFVARGGLVLSVRDYGAKGDGVTDDTAAIQAALTAAANGSAFIPAGVYNISAGLTLPSSASLTVDPGATIVATAAMPAMLSTSTTDLAEDRGITGGIWNCNNLASDGIALGFARHYRLLGITVSRAQRYSFKLGDSSQVNDTYEVMMLNCHASRLDGTLQAGSVGLYVSTKCTDSKFTNVVAMGAETGVSINGGGHHFTAVHAWTRAAVGTMLTAFDDTAGNNSYVNCYADTPSLYGFRFRQSGQQSLIGCVVYNNGFTGTDNTMTAVQLDVLDAAVTVVGCKFIASSATHRIAKDFGFTGSVTSAGATLFGNMSQNVAAQATNNKTAVPFDPSIRSYPSASGVLAFDAKLGTEHSVTLAGNVTASSILNPVYGQQITIVLTQDATGGRTFSWPTDVRFAGGIPPSDTTASNRTAVTFFYNSAQWLEISRASGVSGTSAIVTKSTTYTATTNDQLILGNGGASGITVTIPAPAPGRRLTIKKIDSAAGAVTVTAAGGTIDGAANKVLSAQYQSATFISDGGNWFVI